MIKTKTARHSVNGAFLEHLSIRILNLPFGFTQGDELVESFRISIFGFSILQPL